MGMSADFKQQSLWDEPPAEEDFALAEDIANLQLAFERQVLQGLAAEWENACWLLHDPLRRSLKKPIFSIGGTARRLGSWTPYKREIALSRDLVNNSRWDDVREVLLHEMAHQVAHEGFKALGEPDHGPAFKKACRLLRANPAASGTHFSLHERLRRGEKLDAKDRIVTRIQKLMALAESANPNEAHAAMSKAHELISRHNVDLIDRGVKQHYVSIFLGTPRLRHFRENYHLAHLLQDFYFVQCMWVEAWALEKARMGRVLEISGSDKNVRIAEYVYQAVRRYIDTTWAEYRRGKGLNRYRKTDFAVGVIEGFRSTLEKVSESSTETSRLPARLDDSALQRYVAHRYPHVRSFSRQGPGHDARVLADGNEKGRKLVIAKGISHSDGYLERVIEYKK
ncbi:hypothetical protein DSCW_02290 [Desulfosarcina widdelii]|uniref:DUF2786 domain-containing protein n=1 Tax=Desulfosarcina widdelii TaxID=947919 RepID=A0A5K7YSK1_9BACT|nr:DUF2786 domain-containing protein [Desulfosarcina widdelii]BBO72812.1 hypothetical protein DSCW_02290 [Desulfosarcina widdelii]